MTDDARAEAPDSTGAAVGAGELPATLPLLDRERSILQFNRRVLAQARRVDVPLLERLRYITIVSSNLDEFFEVRVADIIEATRAARLWRHAPRPRFGGQGRARASSTSSTPSSTTA